MRRTLGVLTAIAATAVLTGLGGASAAAATGTLYVSDIPYANPTGCKNGAGMRIHVRNDTDVAALVHLQRDCQGPVVTTVQPGEARVVLGASVHIG